jgi:hypothetical protein
VRRSAYFLRPQRRLGNISAKEWIIENDEDKLMTLTKALEEVSVRTFWVFRQGLSCMTDLRSCPAVKDVVFPCVVVIKHIREITPQDFVVVALLSRHI